MIQADRDWVREGEGEERKRVERYLTGTKFNAVVVQGEHAVFKQSFLCTAFKKQETKRETKIMCFVGEVIREASNGLHPFPATYTRKGCHH